MARHVAIISSLFSVEDSAPITITHISLCLSKTDSWLYWRKEVIYRPPPSEIAEANEVFEYELDELGEERMIPTEKTIPKERTTLKIWKSECKKSTKVGMFTESL